MKRPTFLGGVGIAFLFSFFAAAVFAQRAVVDDGAVGPALGLHGWVLRLAGIRVFR